MNKEIVLILVKRFLSSILILFLLISFIFILLRIAPGDPVQKFVSPELSPELASKVRESFHLKDSIFDQYISYLGNLAKGDLGVSYNYRTSVLSIIGDFLPFTIILALLSFLFQIIFGFTAAIASIKRKDGFLDRTITKISYVIYSMPSFVLAIVLIFIFSITLNLLPSADLKSIYFDDLSWFEKLFDYLSHLILPVLTISSAGIVVFYKYLRENIESIYEKSFVLYLRANGISEKEILFKHVIPNSISPLISIAGIELGILLSGALITEVIFSLPGMGRLTVNAILLRDYPLVVGCTLVSGVLIIASNFLADFVKIFIDKRVARNILN